MTYYMKTLRPFLPITARICLYRQFLRKRLGPWELTDPCDNKRVVGVFSFNGFRWIPANNVSRPCRQSRSLEHQFWHIFTRENAIVFSQLKLAHTAPIWQVLPCVMWYWAHRFCIQFYYNNRWSLTCDSLQLYNDFEYGGSCSIVDQTDILSIDRVHICCNRFSPR